MYQAQFFKCDLLNIKDEVIKRFSSWEISALASMSDPELVESTYFGNFIIIAKNMKKRFQKGNHIRMTFEV